MIGEEKSSFACLKCNLQYKKCARSGSENFLNLLQIFLSMPVSMLALPLREAGSQEEEPLFPWSFLWIRVGTRE